MPFETESSDVGKTRGLNWLPDFSARARLSELMDEPCPYQECRACLRDLAKVNLLTHAYHPTLQWLSQFAGNQYEQRPLHIVDVGCGGGDLLRHIEYWAQNKRIITRLTGVDLNPHAIRAAREFTPADSRIQWIAGDAYSFDTDAEPIDLVVSSLFTHHLEDVEILGFLEWMERVARLGWFINDLYRTRVSYFGFKTLAMVARWHRFVRHDGPVSIRRAFLPNDWRHYAEGAGISPRSIRIDIRWPARICVARIK
jgi:SAM-dependent methyltransferase